MNILVVSNNYPSYISPNHGAFVYNLIQEFAKKNNVKVISPQRLHKIFGAKCKTYGEENAEVLRPTYLSLSDRSIVGVKTLPFTDYFYMKSVKRAIRSLSFKPDVIYTHFLKNAKSILDYAVGNNIPLIVASGESSYSYWDKLSEDSKEKMIKNITHIICVSELNKSKLLSFGFNEEKLSVVPNAVDLRLFRPLDKIACKEKIGITNETFVIGFIGHFIERKGPNRLINAIKLLEEQDIKLVCVGDNGKLENNNFTIALKPVPNYKLPEIINSFDIFVLPTLSEGHCNIIEEVKACGIPIISSKGTTVENQIDSSVGFLINPLDVEEIANRIKQLKDDFILRNEMSKKLINSYNIYSIKERAEKIMNIINEICE